MSTIAQQLRHRDELFLRDYAGVAGGKSFHNWLLENGEAFGPAIKVPGAMMGAQKECYSNSLQAVVDHAVDSTEWFYTEGVVLAPGLPILIDHAWLSNRKEEVLDLTLRDQDGAEYYGIPFKPDWAVSATIRHGYYGLFSDGCTYNKDVVFKPVGRTKRAWKKKELANVS
jgi:hypothetical protein